MVALFKLITEPALAYILALMTAFKVSAILLPTITREDEPETVHALDSVAEVRLAIVKN